MLTSCSFAKNDLVFCRHKLSSSAITTRSTRSFKAAASIGLTQGTKGAMIEHSLNPKRPMELHCLQILPKNIVFQLVPRVRPLKRCSRPWIWPSGYYRKLISRKKCHATQLRVRLLSAKPSCAECSLG